MKVQILHSLRSCFVGIEERKEEAILDPRFKDRWLLEEEMANVITL